jgi:hypothetical protein
MYEITSSKLIIPSNNDNFSMDEEEGAIKFFAPLINILTNAVFGSVKDTDTHYIENPLFEAAVEEYANAQESCNPKLYNFCKMLFRLNIKDENPELITEFHTFRKSYIVPDLVKTLQSTLTSSNIYQENMSDSVIAIASLAEYECFMHSDEMLINYFCKIGELKLIFENTHNIGVIVMVLNKILKSFNNITTLTEYINKKRKPVRECIKSALRKIINESNLPMGKWTIAGRLLLFIKLHANYHGINAIITFFSSVNKYQDILYDDFKILKISICPRLIEKVNKIMVLFKNNNIKIREQHLYLKNTDLRQFDNISIKVKSKIRPCGCVNKCNNSCSLLQQVVSSPCASSMVSSSPCASSNTNFGMGGGCGMENNMSIPEKCYCSASKPPCMICKLKNMESELHKLRAVPSSDLHEWEKLTCGHQKNKGCKCTLKDALGMSHLNKLNNKKCDQCTFCNKNINSGLTKMIKVRDEIRPFCSNGCMVSYKANEESDTSNDEGSDYDNDDHIEEYEDGEEYTSDDDDYED